MKSKIQEFVIRLRKVVRKKLLGGILFSQSMRMDVHVSKFLLKWRVFVLLLSAFGRYIAGLYARYNRDKRDLSLNIICGS